MKCTVVIPTILEKKEWLERTLFGIGMQKDVELSVIVCVDKKPWDPTDNYQIKTDLAYIQIPEDMAVTFNVERESSVIKRQHGMINHAVAILDPEELVLIMDDDYWITDPNGIHNMVSAWEPGKVIGCKWYYDTFHGDVPILSRYSYGNPISYFSTPLDELAIIRLENNTYGMHPMCGTPKLFSANDFINAGGFDTYHFKHYWFADTDLFYRVKHNYEIELVDIPCIHARHERTNPDAFGKINAKKFLQLYENSPIADACHINKARETIAG